ncbi:response regulator transcription factor [Cumulibacter soli]|uniref:response regulator transcription factor n=1 Tax=Cumulibacter soli TaxID=2546344 RepID=UPI001ABB0B8B|nr:response regulator transcription factor [Cumulibacter soli]
MTIALPETSPRVVVIDDDTIIRDGARVLLSESDVVACYENVEEFLSDRPDVDVVLLDLNLHGTGTPRTHGAAGVNAVSKAGYKVLIYTNERRLLVLASCLGAGAKAIVHKAEPVAALQEAIEEVRRGGTVITVALTGLAEAVREHGRMQRLTRRQREILEARARGESFKSIGRRLFISERTAQDHMNKVNEVFCEYLSTHSAADLERHLGIAAGDLNNL